LYSAATLTQNSSSGADSNAHQQQAQSVLKSSTTQKRNTLNPTESDTSVVPSGLNSTIHSILLITHTDGATIEFNSMVNVGTISEKSLRREAERKITEFGEETELVNT
jgi:hypothetical protein